MGFYVELFTKRFWFFRQRHLFYFATREGVYAFTNKAMMGQVKYTNGKFMDVTYYRVNKALNTKKR